MQDRGGVRTGWLVPEKVCAGVWAGGQGRGTEQTGGEARPCGTSRGAFKNAGD